MKQLRLIGAMGRPILAAFLVASASNTLAEDPIPFFTRNIDVHQANVDDNLRSLVIDQRRNQIYLTGSSKVSASNAELNTLGRQANGDALWSKNATSTSDEDRSRMVKVDSEGNVVVLGEVTPSLGNVDIAIVKYAANGDFKWQRNFNGAGDLTDNAQALFIDAEDNIYFTGSVGTAANGSDMVVGKYAPDGNIQWSRTFDWDAHGTDVGYDVAAVPYGGDVFVTGGSTKTAGQGTELRIWRYRSTSETVPITTYSGSDNLSERGVHAALQKNGNIVIVGDRSGYGTGLDVIIAAFDSISGEAVWSESFDGLGHSNDLAFGLAIDPSDNIYVLALSFQSVVNGSGIATLKYDKNGVLLYSARHDTPGAQSDFPADIDADPFGNAYVVGTTNIGDANGDDIFVMKLAPNGGTVWSHTQVNAGNDSAAAIQVLPNGTFVAGGTSQGAASTNYFIRGWMQNPVPVADSYQTAEFTGIKANVLANDQFHQGSTLTVTTPPTMGNVILSNDGNFYYEPFISVYGPDSFAYTITRGGVTSLAASVGITIHPVRPSSFSLSPATIVGGSASTGTVFLDRPAPYSVFEVAITDNSSAITTPSDVGFLKGNSSAAFQVSSAAVTAPVTRQITVSHSGVSKTASLTLNPGGLASITLTPTAIKGGQSVNGTVTLSGPAPTGGKVVTISDNSSAITSPPSATVAQGTTSKSFAVGTLAVTSQVVRQVSAKLDTVTKTASLTINP